MIPGELVVRLQLPLLAPSRHAEGAAAARARRCSTATGSTTTLAWTLGGQPFLTPPGTLERCGARRHPGRDGHQPELSTTGGTSDGRFIARICPQVIEFGPVNASIHKIDERVAVADIEPLKNIYRRTLESAGGDDADRH